MSDFKEISIEKNNSYARGFSCSIQDNHLIDHLENQNLGSNDGVNRFLAILRKRGINELTVLEDLWVDDDYQGQGLGKLILNEFISASDSQCIILLLDTAQPQRKNFKLLKFYQLNGFDEFEQVGWLIKTR